jgi:hypothetical protein
LQPSAAAIHPQTWDSEPGTPWLVLKRRVPFRSGGPTWGPIWGRTE